MNSKEHYKNLLSQTRQIIGSRLKESREIKGVTYADIQRNSYLSPAQISAIEQGSKNYSIDSLIQYLAGADIEILFGPELFPFRIE